MEEWDLVEEFFSRIWDPVEIEEEEEDWGFRSRFLFPFFLCPPSRPFPRMKVSGPWAHHTKEVGMRYWCKNKKKKNTPQMKLTRTIRKRRTEPSSNPVDRHPEKYCAKCSKHRWLSLLEPFALARCWSGLSSKPRKIVRGCQTKLTKSGRVGLTTQVYTFLHQILRTLIIKHYNKSDSVAFVHHLLRPCWRQQIQYNTIQFVRVIHLLRPEPSLYSKFDSVVFVLHLLRPVPSLYSKFDSVAFVLHLLQKHNGETLLYSSTITVRGCYVVVMS